MAGYSQETFETYGGASTHNLNTARIGTAMDYEGETMTTTIDSGQKLHLVFGGELENLDGVNFRDVKGLDIVGIFPDYASAQSAWKSKAQATVDSAQTRYFIVHLHRLLEP